MSKVMLVGQVSNGKKVVGYSVLDINSNRAKLMTIPETREIIKSIGCVNAVVGSDGKISGTQASLDRLPIYDIGGKIVAQPRVTVLGELVKDGDTVGYMLMDAWGRKGKFSISGTIELIKKYESTNAKVVKRGNTTFISAILGEFDRIVVGNEGKKLWKEDNDEFKESDVKSDAKSEEPMVMGYTDARYIGSKDVSCGYPLLYYNSAIKYYRLLNVVYGINFNKNMLNHENEDFNAVRRAMKCSFYTKLLKNVSKGLYGKRTQKHYKNSMELLNKLGNPEDVASKLLYAKAALRVLRMNYNPSLYDDVVNCIKFTEACIKDMMLYKRANLVVKYSKDLRDTLCNSKKALGYLSKEVGHKVDKDYINKIIVDISKDDIDTKSSLIYLLVLELVWFNSVNTEKLGRIMLCNKYNNIIEELLNNKFNKIGDGDNLYNSLLLYKAVNEALR